MDIVRQPAPIDERVHKYRGVYMNVNLGTVNDPLPTVPNGVMLGGENIFDREKQPDERHDNTWRAPTVFEKRIML